MWTGKSEQYRSCTGVEKGVRTEGGIVSVYSKPKARAPVPFQYKCEQGTRHTRLKIPRKLLSYSSTLGYMNVSGAVFPPHIYFDRYVKKKMKENPSHSNISTKPKQRAALYFV